ncbi:MAG TPA: citrate/2-methylcitrate synthase [Stellaceae bacterium]|jgi:citrate synthase|nr:citrate/2-methylcitrate synthase [Stellaceae bacterium]
MVSTEADIGTSSWECRRDLCCNAACVDIDSSNQYWIKLEGGIPERIRLLSAREAADRLGVKIDTLYAYVSRGLLRSKEVAGSRERHYDAEEVERFREGRGTARASSAPPEALMPVIPSAICLIEDHRFYYRGRDALELAETASLEQVAAILWEEPEQIAAPHPNPLPARGERVAAAKRRSGEGRGALERCQVRLAELAPADLAALDLSPSGVVRTGRLVVAELTACVTGAPPSLQPIHEQLAALWRLDDAGADLVRRCLVLLADHELNASTFVARCVASTGATPYAVVSGALAALSGRRHGGASARAEALFHELGEAEPAPILAARLARDDDIPGLGHPLYLQGDPRALAIIEALKQARPEAGARAAAAAVAAMELTGKLPNVDFGLGATTTALGLPAGAALAIFLIARSVGWIAHAMEQYQSGVLIRPRARYIGKPALPVAE